MSATVLAVRAYADDQTCGMAGTLARHAVEGDVVHLLFLADRVTTRDGAYEPTRGVAGTAARKMAAIRAYDAEVRAFPPPCSPEAIEVLWRLRGAQAGLTAAEALVAVRERV